MSQKEKKKPWYVGGLHFECSQCGNCCSGPGEGYIWITRPEIEFLVDFLKIPIGQLRRKYTRRVGLRMTIIEEPATKNCIFLKNIDGWKKCRIYPVRPNQCRNWPFWPSNLATSNAWNKAAQKCNGINHGRHYSFEEITELKSRKKWWGNDK